jgi:hypothetical protein
MLCGAAVPDRQTSRGAAVPAPADVCPTACLPAPPAQHRPAICYRADRQIWGAFASGLSVAVSGHRPETSGPTHPCIIIRLPRCTCSPATSAASPTAAGRGAAQRSVAESRDTRRRSCRRNRGAPCVCLTCCGAGVAAAPSPPAPSSSSSLNPLRRKKSGWCLTPAPVSRTCRCISPLVGRLGRPDTPGQRHQIDRTNAVATNCSTLGPCLSPWAVPSRVIPLHM